MHRDLKPGNVMLTKPGIKLLDFGLAKTRQANVTPTEGSEQPTRHKPLTDAGTILGTVQYMAPEQLEGKDVDARADLFALGAILFEMVTGRKAFQGESQASLISAIMSTEPPPVSQLHSLSPPALDASPQAARSTAGSGGRRFYVVAGLAVLAIMAAAIGFFLPHERGTDAVYRVDVEIPENHSLLTFREAPFALSPDGETIVYSARDNDVFRLYRRSLLDFEAVPISGTEGARAPFFSPDGTWIGFFALGALRKVPTNGGAPLVIGETGSVSPSASWGDDDRILFSIETRSGLRIVQAGGGEPQTVTTPRYDR